MVYKGFWERIGYLFSSSAESQSEPARKEAAKLFQLDWERRVAVVHWLYFKKLDYLTSQFYFFFFLPFYTFKSFYLLLTLVFKVI